MDTGSPQSFVRYPLPTNRRRAAKQKSSPTVKPRKGFLIWPTKGTLTSRFGMRNGRKHEGIDIAAPKGTPILCRRRRRSGV